MSTDDTNAPEGDIPDGPGEGERIAKVLSRAGVASRRDCERLVLEGRVRRNGVVVASPAVNVLPTDRLEVDGRRVAEAEPTRLWLFHKPPGLVTTERDEEGRETVFEALPAEMPRVMSVGRLDLTSEGLLLLTNDGQAKRRLELPSTGWLRRYRVRINGALSEESLDQLRRGITVDGFDYEPMEVEFDRQQGANAWLTVGLREGKNREIRRVMEHLGVQVNRLIRVSYGPFQLGNLGLGEVEEVRPKVVRDQLGLGTAPKRTRRPALSADLPPPEVVRPARDALAAKLPEGAVKRSLKPRAAPKARAERDAPRAPARPLPATRPGPTGQRPLRTFMRKDGPRPVTETTEAEARAAARAAREATREAGPQARPERRGDRPRNEGDRPRPDRAQGDRPRSAAFRSHGSGEGNERPRAAGFKSQARPSREGGEGRARSAGPRGPRAGEEGAERPRARAPRREGEPGAVRPERSPDRSASRFADRSPDRARERSEDGPGRPARFERSDRGPRSEGDRPARAPRHGRPGAPDAADGTGRPPRDGARPQREGARSAPRPRREEGEARPAREGAPRAIGSRPDRPRSERPRSDRPRDDGPRSGPPRGDGARTFAPKGGARSVPLRGDRPGPKPGGGPRKGPPRGGTPSGRKPRKD